MAERQRWFGEKTCDICGKEIKGVLYDACRKDTPEWAAMCRKCYRLYASPIGWGSGQKYEEDEDGEFYLVAGGEPEENYSNKENPDMSVNDILRMFFKS